MNRPMPGPPDMARGLAHGAREAEAHWRGGLAHARAGRWKEAEKAYARAARSAPRDPLYWVNLGQARRKLGDPSGAAQAAQAALSVDAGHAIARQMLQASLVDQHRYGDALAAALAATQRADATHVDWADCGHVLYQVGRHQEAVSALLRAVARKMDFFPAYVMLCNVFHAMGLHQEAVEALRTVTALAPHWRPAHAGILYHSLHACLWDRLEEDTAALRAAGERAEREPVNPFMYLSVGTCARDQLAAIGEHARANFGPIRPMPAVDPARALRQGRIHVGYLSNDFHQHATAMLLVQVLELHDRNRFRVTLYSYGPNDGSAMRARLERAGDAFVDVRETSDAEVARRIRDDGVDVLVDLKGYTLHARPAIVALRPAPVQVSYLGFPGTMGAGFVDYLVTDPIVTPPAMADAFAEKLAFMPQCYQPNDRQREVGPTPARADCGLPPQGFVFCCFNNTYKIRPEVFEVWCRLLAAVPGSVLWLLASNPQAVANLQREAQRRGIDPQRLVFAPMVAPAANLARLAHADLFLDTLPINAHTTASDALWAGVPLVTCAGDSFVARVAASLLHAAGLPQLVATDLAQYESIALRVARDPGEAAALRRQLLATRLQAPLFDSERYARAFERLLERMVARWRAGLAPEELAPEHDTPERPSEAR